MNVVMSELAALEGSQEGACCQVSGWRHPVDAGGAAALPQACAARMRDPFYAKQRRQTTVDILIQEEDKMLTAGMSSDLHEKVSMLC